MSSVGPQPGPPGPPGPPLGARAVWSPVPTTAAALGCAHAHAHAAGGGRLDESARRLSHEELAAARLLVREGHDVRSLPESRRDGRRPDLQVCGDSVEVKSFAPMAERRRQPTAQSVFNKLIDASGQAAHAVLIATGSGLSESVARQGVARYAAGSGWTRPATLSSVRIVGDGYDLAWARRPAVELRSARSVPAVSASDRFGIGI